MLSSLAGLMGTAGQANYVAGCSYQVALAAHRRSRGQPAASVDIGYVSGVGFIAEHATAAIEQNLTNIGMGDIKEAKLHAMLQLAIRDTRLANQAQGHLITISPRESAPGPSHHNLAIYAADSSRTAPDELPFFARDPVFSHLEVFRPHLYQTAPGVDDPSDAGRRPLQTTLNGSISITDAHELALNALQHKAARLLMMPAEVLDSSLSLGAYGVDSLVAIEVRNWFLREAKADISIFDILNAHSLRSRAENVVSKTRLFNEQVAEST